MTKSIVTIYRSPKKAEMYLYVHKADELKRVPPPLLELFGTPQLVTTMLLTAEKKLARARADEVLHQLDEKGYYLQMPPVEESEMKAIAEKNSKLGRL